MTPSRAHQRILFSDEGKGLKNRRVRLLQEFRDHTHGFQNAVFGPAAILLRRVEVPRCAGARNFPITPLGRHQFLRPGLLDDAEVFLEGLAVRGVDLVVFGWHRTTDAVRLLGVNVDPATLVAARESRVGAAIRHVIEHCDVFGDA